MDDLSQAKMIEISDTDLSPLNLGMIAAFYYLRYQTVELFASTITKKAKLKGLLAFMSAAAEFDALAGTFIRHFLFAFVYCCAVLCICVYK